MSANGKHVTAEAEAEEEPLSPAARLFHTPKLNLHIVSVIGCKSKINPAVVIQGLENTLIKHPRFSSIMVNDKKKRRKPRWVRTTVNVPDHITIPAIDDDPNRIQNPDQFMDDYVSKLSTIPLEKSKPLWELHILNLKTPESESTAILKIHHSLGDGISLMSLVLACTRKSSDPDQIPTVPVIRRHSVSERYADRTGVLRLVLAVWTVLRLGFNSLVDMFYMLVTVLFLRDTGSPVKGGQPGSEFKPRRFVHRTVSLDDVKLVKNAMKMTINDVLLGVTQAGLSLYLNRRYGENEKDEKKRERLLKRIRLRSTVMLNLRPTTGIQALADMMSKGSSCQWGNSFGHILLPFSIGLLNNPLDHLRQAKATIDRKKHSLEAILTFASAKFVVWMFGPKACAALIRRMLSNTTMSFSNMVGPLEEISFYGHPLAYAAPGVYGTPQALTLHIMSYINTMTICVTVDPEVIPDPYQLCDDFEESLKNFKAAVLDRGFPKDDMC